jgi:hypothetical protein
MEGVVRLFLMFPATDGIAFMVEELDLFAFSTHPELCLPTVVEGTEERFAGSLQQTSDSGPL